MIGFYRQQGSFRAQKGAARGLPPSCSVALLPETEHAFDVAILPRYSPGAGLKTVAWVLRPEGEKGIRETGYYAGAS